MHRLLLVLLIALECQSCIQPTPQQVDAVNKMSGNLAAVGADMTGKLTYIAAAFIPDGDKSFQVHGKWCGRGFPTDEEIRANVRVVSNGRKQVILVKPNLYPEDDVDLACARHDICYLSTPDDRFQKMGTARGDCDIVLMCKMFEILQSGRRDLIPSASKVLAWAGGAAWRRLSSDCRRMGVRRSHDWDFVVDQS